MDIAEISVFYSKMTQFNPKGEYEWHQISLENMNDKKNDEVTGLGTLLQKLWKEKVKRMIFFFLKNTSFTNAQFARLMVVII